VTSPRARATQSRPSSDTDSSAAAGWEPAGSLAAIHGIRAATTRSVDSEDGTALDLQPPAPDPGRSPPSIVGRSPAPHRDRPSCRRVLWRVVAGQSPRRGQPDADPDARPDAASAGAPDR